MSTNTKEQQVFRQESCEKLAEALRLARDWFRYEEAGEGPQAEDVIKAADEALAAHDAEQAGEQPAQGEREAFEALCTEGCKFPSTVTRDETGEYHSPFTAPRWKYFRAGAAHARATLAHRPEQAQIGEIVEMDDGARVAVWRDGTPEPGTRLFAAPVEQAALRDLECPPDPEMVDRALAAADQKRAYARAALAQRQPLTASGWIPVAERLPEPDSGEVMVWAKFGDEDGRCAFDEWYTHREDPIGMSTMHTLDMGCMWRDYEFDEITHWMPLPAAPQEPTHG